MGKTQFMLIAAAIALVALIYFAGNRVPPAPKPEGNTANRDQAKQGSEQAGMQQTEINAERWEVIQAKALAALNTEEKAQVQALGNGTDKESLIKLAAWWKGKNQPYLSTKYAGELAKLENSEKSLTFAAQNFIALLNLEPEPSMKGWLAKESIALLDSALVKNPNNINAQIMKATCLVETGNNPMEGVQMLLGIVRADSNNLPATIALGKFAIKSGQWQKAVSRFEKAISLDPKNAEALYHLAESYKNSGNIAKAKETFTKWKQMLNNPEASKEIDEYLKTF